MDSTVEAIKHSLGLQPACSSIGTHEISDSNKFASADKRNCAVRDVGYTRYAIWPIPNITNGISADKTNFTPNRQRYHVIKYIYL